MLINLRNALMTGKRLPYDAEVEYLESTGTQWIDTGAITSPTTIFEIVYKFSSSSAAIAGGIGLTSGLGGINNNPTRFLINKDALAQYNIGLGDFAGHFGSFNTSLHTLTLNAQAKTFTVDSDEFTLPATTFTGGFSIPLFARLGPSGIGNFSSGQLYSCKIWDGSSLVRDFIPVRKGTVGYLYDRVSGKLFGNAGTGDFQYGQDVVPVEYIESHGTEYIDTGVYQQSDTEYMATLMPVSSGNCAIGNQGGGGAYGYRLSFHTAGVFQDWYSSRISLAAQNFNVMYTATVRRGYLNVKSADGSVDLTATGSQTSTATSTMPMYVFTAGPSSSGAMGTIRYYSLKILNGTTLVRTMKAIRIGNEGAMMDVLTRRIYRNAGTGAFTYGNDLKYPIPAE